MFGETRSRNKIAKRKEALDKIRLKQILEEAEKRRALEMAHLDKIIKEKKKRKGTARKRPLLDTRHPS